MDLYLVNTHCLTCHTTVLHNTLLPPLPYLIHSTTDGAPTAVLVSVVVTLLLLTLLIAGITIGLVLLRRAKRKRIVLEKKGKLIERIEFVEKKEENLEELAAKGGKSTAGSNREQRIDDEVALHYERVQHEEELHYDSVDVPRQGCVSRVDGGGIRSEADHYEVIDAADVLLKDGVGHGMKEKGQQDDQRKGTPINAVYAVVDKSKKMKQKKIQGGASATTTQGIYTEEQHYECSSVFGQDWLGNWVGEKPEGNYSDVGQGDPSNEAKETGPQSEPCNPNAVYAVVDKRKNRNTERNDAPGPTATEGMEGK